MTRSEVLQVAKPILFNTEMVQAILDGRKTVTRRVMKPQPKLNGRFWEIGGAGWSDEIKIIHPVPGDSLYNRMPYEPGDYLYVRETWCQPAKHIYWYRADSKNQNLLWRPSIHMPKEAARIFLRVTDVRVERLREIEKDGLIKEGVNPFDDNFGELEYAIAEFAALWDSTIKAKDRDKYGWKANPWVWAIEFERIQAC